MAGDQFGSSLSCHGRRTLTQVPLPLQTWSVPQEVPALTLPSSMQTSAPVLHSTAPVVQALPVLQEVPAAQPMQLQFLGD